MFRFANPISFLLLIPLGIAAWMLYRRTVRSGILFAPLHRVPIQQRTWRIFAETILPAMTLLGIAMAVAALARPQKVLSRMRQTADVIAIQMVVDASGSMDALDLSIKTKAGMKYRSRLDAVKDTFKEFVKRRPNDIIGLITFGGYATTRAPMTSDHAALLHTLSGIETAKAVMDRNRNILNKEEFLTAVGDALATACGRLEQSEAKSRIVVLLTDGESNTGVIKPEEATRLASGLGLKVYTIGVGSTGKAPFMVRDIFGRPAIRHSMVSLDEKLLRKIAEDTGGKYFNVIDPEGLDNAMTEIDELEKTSIEQDIYSRHNELFPFCLVPGLAMILAGTALRMLINRRIL